MEGRGYNKSAFTSESGFLARALRWFKHDHTYAKTKAKEMIGDDSVHAESKEGWWISRVYHLFKEWHVVDSQSISFIPSFKW